MQWLWSFKLRIHCKHTKSLAMQSCRDRTSNAHHQRMCRAQIKVSLPRHWIIDCHSNNSFTNRSENMLWLDKQISFNPYSILAQPFQATGSVISQNKNPSKCRVLTWDPPRLSAPLGSGIFMLRWFVTPLVTPQPHLTCCSSSSLTPPQLIVHLMNPPTLPPRQLFCQSDYLPVLPTTAKRPGKLPFTLACAQCSPDQRPKD